MSVASNSEAVLEGLVDRCNASLQCGEHGGLKSLEAYRDAGAALRELKELLPRGQFGPIAQARCGCSKQWCARLMQLDREWADVPPFKGPTAPDRLSSAKRIRLMAR